MANQAPQIPKWATDLVESLSDISSVNQVEDHGGYNFLEAPFEFEDIVRAFHVRRTDPVEAFRLISDHVTFQGRSITGAEFTEGTTRFLVNDFEPTETFSVSLDTLAVIAYEVPDSLKGEGFRHGIDRAIKAATTFESLDPAEMSCLVSIVAKISEDEKRALFAGLIPQNQRANVHPHAQYFNQAERIALALVAKMEVGLMYGNGQVPITANSYSPRELGIAFGNCVPEKILPNVLAFKAAQKFSELDSGSYEFLFDPSSIELDGLDVEGRQKLAGRFLTHLGVALRDIDGPGNVRDRLAEKFGAAIAAHPDFNRPIIEKFGDGFSSSFQPNAQVLGSR